MVARSRVALVAGVASLVGLVGGGAPAAQPAKQAPQPAKQAPQPAKQAPQPAKQAPVAAAAGGSLMARADELAKQVASLRGLPLRAPIVKEIVDRRELRRRLVEMTGQPKEAGQLVREEVLSKHWGLVPRELDYHAMLLDVLSAQIAGYYDSDTKRLTLTDDPAEDPDWSEMVLSHEILHALQDQTFALSKFREVPPGEDDAAAARIALVEGDGVGTMLEVYNKARGLTLPWQSSASLLQTAEALAEATEPDAEGTPLAVREALAFPYTAGFRFVAELRRQQPWSAVDAAFRRPPVSTEQILHPELYLRNELPLPVASLALPAAVQRAVVAAAATTTGPTPAATNPAAKPATTTTPPAPTAKPGAATPPPTTGPTAPTAKPAPALPDATALALEQARRELRGKAQLETVWGELGFALFLRSHGIDGRTAKIAAAGWGGDRVTVLALDRPGQEVGVARMRWDSEPDAREAFEATVKAVDRWLDGLHFQREAGRARWADAEGRVSLVERRDASLVIVHRAPATTLTPLVDELWRSLPPQPAAAAPPPVPLTAPPPPPAKKSRRDR